MSVQKRKSRSTTRLTLSRSRHSRRSRRSTTIRNRSVTRGQRGRGKKVMVRKTRRNRQSGGNTDAFVVKYIDDDDDKAEIQFYDSMNTLLKQEDDNVKKYLEKIKLVGRSNASALTQWQQSNAVTISAKDVESIKKILKSNTEIDTYLFENGPSETKPVQTVVGIASALGSKVGSVASGAANAIKNRVATVASGVTGAISNVVSRANTNVHTARGVADIIPQDNDLVKIILRALSDEKKTERKNTLYSNSGRMLLDNIKNDRPNSLQSLRSMLDLTEPESTAVVTAIDEYKKNTANN